MIKSLMEINNQAGVISANVNNIEGQMVFLGHLIEDFETQPDIVAIYMEKGIIQKQLNAIYNLFDCQLKEIKELNQDIFNLSELEIEKEKRSLESEKKQGSNKGSR